ncbi:MAG: type II toxin-antitoxin system RelE/ParE family toxin [bacterium]|nr:type II toxin-antitoxin system RelE/ParE family toxin [bacterium]MDP2703974.1 type II toxin-antitoxin system RelE/ParE family toxin [bacterium]
MNADKNWGLKVRTRAEKTIARFPRKDALVLLEAIELLPRNPFAGDIEKMKGEENIWRRRIGAYRIFYELRINENVVYVFRVERRASKTY